MKVSRRKIIQYASMSGAALALAPMGAFLPGTLKAEEWNKTAFEKKTLDEAMKAMGIEKFEESADVVIDAPEIAENGNVVPLNAESKIAGTTRMSVFVENNPSPLATNFDFTGSSIPFFGTRIKMSKTSNVYVVAMANGKAYANKQEIKITLGGCGG